MINFLTKLLQRLRLNQPQRVLRRATSCRTVWDLQRICPAVVMQVRNESLRRPGTFKALGAYIHENFPELRTRTVGTLDLSFGSIPSLVPEHEQFAVVYLIHDHRLFDSGLIACVFDGDKEPSLLVRDEVVYGPRPDSWFSPEPDRGLGDNVHAFVPR